MKSPLSLCVTFESLKRGQNLTLEAALMMELKVFLGFLNNDECGELHEGVRALLIDKDQKPKWKHKSIFDVKEDEVDWFFDRYETYEFE